MRLTDQMRCVSCNARFERLSLPRSALFLVSVGALLALVSWGATVSGPGRARDQSPRVRQVPSPPPPVLNR